MPVQRRIGVVLWVVKNKAVYMGVLSNVIYVAVCVSFASKVNLIRLCNASSRLLIKRGL